MSSTARARRVGDWRSSVAVWRETAEGTLVKGSAIGARFGSHRSGPKHDADLQPNDSGGAWTCSPRPVRRRRTRPRSTRGHHSGDAGADAVVPRSTPLTTRASYCRRRRSGDQAAEDNRRTLAARRGLALAVVHIPPVASSSRPNCGGCYVYGVGVGEHRERGLRWGLPGVTRCHRRRDHAGR